MTRPARFLSILILAALMIVPCNVFSCGPFFAEAVFTYQQHPDYPLKLYANGNIGLVQPSYHRTYLVVAYRYLVGKPLSPVEREESLSAWSRELYEPFSAVSTSKDSVSSWYAARNQALHQQPKDQEEHSTRAMYKGGYDGYLNCPSSAYETALKTLSQRRNSYTTAELIDWVKAQDAVFSNCENPTAIPAAAPQNASVLFKADREYQIAAAQFYSEQFDAARTAFQKIAAEENSPWHEMAPYLATRALIRKATLSAPAGKDFSPELLTQAEAELRAIAADPKLRTIHGPARRLLGFVVFRLHPEQRLRQLVGQLSVIDSNFGQDLIDYTWLLDKMIGEAPDAEWNSQDTGEVRERKEKDAKREYGRARYKALEPARSASDLTDWVLTFQSDAPEARQHALAKWKQALNVPWLVAAVSKIRGTDREAEEILNASTSIKSDSPAFLMVSYHRARLLRERGGTAQARQLFDTLLATSKGYAPPSAINAILRERMQVAASFDEFLQYAPRNPVNVGMAGVDSENPYCDQTAICRKLLYGEAFESKSEFRHLDQGGDISGKTRGEARFDADGARILNKRLPLDLLVRAAAAKELPPYLRTEVALAAWTRAVILGDDVARQLTPQLSNDVPPLAPYLSARDKETTAEGKKFAGIFAILHFPGMRPYVDASSGREIALNTIDNYRDNWWCSDVGAAIEVVNYEKDGSWFSASAANTRPYDPNPSLPFPAFLTPEQKQAAGEQWKTLAQIGTGPNYLVTATLSYAKAHPDDPRIPEALHFAIRATRYGCDNNQTTRLSREAFTLLHSRYPKSDWAKKTKYWF
jgi:hypothetical protein